MDYAIRTKVAVIKQIVKSLFVIVPTDLETDYLRDCFQVSATRIFYQSAVSAIYAISLLVVTTKRLSSTMSAHSILYIILFTTMIASSILFNKLRSNPPQSIILIKFLPALHGMFILDWAIAVSLFDQTSYGSTTAYDVGLISIATIPYIPPLFSIVIFLCNHIAFVSLLPRFQHNETILFGYYVNTILVVIATWCISRALYSAKLNDFRNIKRLEILNRTTEKLSYIDDLTGIPNKRMLNKYLKSEWKRAVELHHPLSLIFIDIDHFKRFNDIYGHQKGDSCLRRVAKTIESCVDPSSALVGRYGGEEFVVVLPEVDSSEAIKIAQNINTDIASLSLEHGDQGLTGKVTISLGASSIIPTDGISIHELLEKADKALYHSKLHGRNMITHSKNLAI